MRFILILLTFVLICTSCYAQKTTSFYQKIYSFSYPTNPLPSSCEVYGISTQIAKSIFTNDYRGDRLNLHRLKTLWGGYNPNNVGYMPKLHSFKKYNKSKIPFENGFLLSIAMDDVEVYHKYTGKDNLYEIHAKYEYRLSVKHRDTVVVSDAIKHKEVLGSFISELSEEETHIIATNKARDLAGNLNETILKGAATTFQNFTKKTVDLTFNKEYIKFYGITKLKKLSSGEQVKLLDNQLRNLKVLDKDIVNRDSFSEMLQILIKNFEQLKTNKDYNNYKSFRLYVSANLANLYSLNESFDLAEANYKIAKVNVQRERFHGILEDEMIKTMNRKRNKLLMFNENNVFLEELSPAYLKYHTNRIKAIN